MTQATEPSDDGQSHDLVTELHQVLAHAGDVGARTIAALQLALQYEQTGQGTAAAGTGDLVRELIDQNERVQRLAAAVEQLAALMAGQQRSAHHLIQLGRYLERTELAGQRAARQSPARSRSALKSIQGGLASIGVIGAIRWLTGTLAPKPVAVKLAAATLALGAPAAGGVVAANVLNPAHHAAAAPARTGGQVTHGAIVWQASRIPQRGLIALARKPGNLPIASSAAAALVLLPVLASSPSNASGSSAAATSQAGDGQAPAGSQGVIEGTLQVPATVNVPDPTQPVTIELDASGGPVVWGAWCHGAACPGVSLSATSGAIPAGTSELITVTFNAAAQQAGGSVTLRINWKTVTITWQAAPLPAPGPSASATTDTPPSQAPADTSSSSQGGGSGNGLGGSQGSIAGN